MLQFWLVTGLLQTCLCGDLYSHALYGSTMEAHGPLARAALHASGYYYSLASGAGVSPVASAEQPLNRAAGFRAAVVPPVVHVNPVEARRTHLAPSAPLAVRTPSFTAAVIPPHLVSPSPVTPLAPVDLVHHVPSVADVPLTRYTAQHGYVQKLVDVTHPKVATAKLQVRRPAIQKQFYDIEHRTIIRPVGSAVVELDQPVSKKFVSPFTVAPAGHYTVAQFHPSQGYPVGSYPFVSYSPFQVPVQYYPQFIQQTPVLPQLPQRPIARPPQQIPVAPQHPQQPQLPQQPQQPQLPQQPQQPQQPPVIAPRPPQAFPPFTQPAAPSPDNSNTESEFDPSDTVVVDNPDFGRKNKPSEKPLKTEENPVEFSDSLERDLEKLGNELDRTREEEESNAKMIIDEFQDRQFLRKFFIDRNVFPEQLNSPQMPPQSHNNDVDKSQQVSDFKSSEESDSTEEEISTESDSTSGLSSQETTTTTSSYIEANLQKFFTTPLKTDQEETQRATYSNEGQISSKQLSPEESLDNQQKLIELLTGRGGISEVEYSRSGGQKSVGDLGVIRGRVLSVTPAPSSEKSDEQVSTRRVVVSRPIQTLEEVDIQQPFTKLERVAVHQPVLLKTPQTYIARVPTTLPVISRTFTPVQYH